MSKESVKKFYEALKGDNAMVEELQKQADTVKEKSPENAAALVVKFAAAKGYDFTAEDLKAFEAEAQEISADELAKVQASGGKGGVCIAIGLGWGGLHCTDKGDTVCYIIGLGFGTAF